MTTKRCCKCKIDKFLNEFGNDCHRLDGLKPACKKCRNTENKERRDANPTKHREINLAYSRTAEAKHKQWARSLKRKFWPHLSPEQAVNEYHKLLVKQNHCCGLCKKHKSEFTVKLAVDHQHEPFKVRGLLCNKCNRFEVGRHTLQSTKEMVVYLQQCEE